MFGETPIFHVMTWNHPIETSILKWMFRVQGTYHPWDERYPLVVPNFFQWKTTLFHRRYIFIHGGFPIAMLVYRSVNRLQSPFFTEPWLFEKKSSFPPWLSMVVSGFPRKVVGSIKSPNWQYIYIYHLPPGRETRNN